MNAILLSAGFGTRFRPYTNILAKPSIPFLNLPFIGYSMYYANQFRCDNIVVNTHHLPQSIDSTTNKLRPFITSQIKLINEQPQILDSGGGINNAKKFLVDSDSFFVFNTDSPFVFPNLDIDNILQKHKESNALCTFLTCKLPDQNIKTRGIWTSKDSSNVIHIGDRLEDNHEFNHYIGLMILSNKVFNYLGNKKICNIIYDVILPAMQKNNEIVINHNINSFQWHETGHLDGYLNASFSFLDQLLNETQSNFSKELTSILEFYDLKPILYKTNNLNLLTLNKDHLDEDFQLKGHIILDKQSQLNDKFMVENSVIHNQSALTQSIKRKLLI